MRDPSAIKTSGRILLRYTLLQLPELLVVVLVLVSLMEWGLLPRWLAGLLILAWIAKDAVVYPFVWRAYETGGSGRSELMAGRTGTARERLDPSGYIQVAGELWRAETVRGAAPVEAGEKVRVKETRGLTLIVEPAGAAGPGVIASGPRPPSGCPSPPGAGPPTATD